MYSIENEYLRIDARALGGELQSIKSKKSGLEYQWNGNEEFWDFHAPILFPYIGAIKDEKFVIKGKEYEAKGKHSFARHQYFDLTNQDENSMTFTLKHSEDTLKLYPYKFKLDITYKLLENKVFTIYTVTNIDDKEIFFTMGGHPAYMVPLKDGTAFEDYYLQFPEKETISKMVIEGNYFTRDLEPCLQDTDKIELSYDLFKNDAIVFRNTRSKSVAIKCNKHSEYLNFDYADFPFIAFWTKKGAPFLCIEPWYGHGDYTDAKDEFSEKEGMMQLDSNGSFSCQYITEICE